MRACVLNTNYMCVSQSSANKKTAHRNNNNNNNNIHCGVYIYIYIIHTYIDRFYTRSLHRR